MSDVISRDDPHEHESKPARRSVLRWSSAAILSALAFGFKFPELSLSKAFAQSGASLANPGAVDLGAGDVGVLNYAYALEQLEAAFYTQVLATPYAGMDSYERAILEGIRDHEVAHREFFSAVLGRNAIPALTPNFTAVNFGSRFSVLLTARTFEDLGVSAYNGAGQLLTSPQNLLLAGKIVSVEARHAALIRDIIDPLGASFAGRDIVDSNGLDVARLPSQVLPLAAPFIATPISASQLP